MDEQARHEDFEQQVGGPGRAFRLLEIYKRARSREWPDRYPETKEQAFIRLATLQGFSREECLMLLRLQ